MGTKGDHTRVLFRDVQQAVAVVEKDYGVRIRLAWQPLGSVGDGTRGAVTATVYTPSGKRDKRVETAQAYFPSSSHRSIEGAFLRLVYEVCNALGEAVQATPQSPLEDYIANRA